MKSVKILFIVFGLFLLCSCVDGAYHPAFIISDSTKEESVESYSEEDHR